MEGKTRLFSGEVEGFAVHSPDWLYPVAFETGTDQAHFDNFNERWGKRAELDRYLTASVASSGRIPST